MGNGIRGALERAVGRSLRALQRHPPRGRRLGGGSRSRRPSSPARSRCCAWSSLRWVWCTSRSVRTTRLRTARRVAALPDDVVVSREAFLLREYGAFYSEGRHWLTTVDDQQFVAAFRVAGETGARARRRARCGRRSPQRSRATGLASRADAGGALDDRATPRVGVRAQLMKSRRLAFVLVQLLSVASLATTMTLHAVRNGYAVAGTSRFTWALAYLGLLVLTSYAAGLPDTIDGRSPGRDFRMCGRGATLGISFVQLVMGSALLPRFVVFGTAALVSCGWSVVAPRTSGRPMYTPTPIASCSSEGDSTPRASAPTLRTPRSGIRRFPRWWRPKKCGPCIGVRSRSSTSRSRTGRRRSCSIARRRTTAVSWPRPRRCTRPGCGCARVNDVLRGVARQAAGLGARAGVVDVRHRRGPRAAATPG